MRSSGSQPPHEEQDNQDQQHKADKPTSPCECVVAAAISVATAEQGQGVGHMLNTAYYFTPNGNVFEQDKIHRTRWEREKWNTDAGDKLHLFETPFGKIAILICYDIEFPELARMVCEAGADILMVPSCTDDRQGFLRVRYCCHARAIENQVFVVMTSTVGN